MFAAFVVEQFKDADLISKRIAGAPVVTSCQALFGRPPVSFPDIRSARLEEMLNVINTRIPVYYPFMF